MHKWQQKQCKTNSQHSTNKMHNAHWSGQVPKISHLPGFDPWTVQPVANSYTDYAILAACHMIKADKNING
jgi:hypothetical protein